MDSSFMSTDRARGLGKVIKLKCLPFSGEETGTELASNPREN